MKLIILCATALLLFAPSLLLIKSTMLASKLQNLCNKTVNNVYALSETRTAILCGQKITASATQKTLQASGLIHLFIISGSHIVFLYQLFIYLNFPHWLVSLILILLTFVTGFQAPVVRACIQYFLNRYSKKNKLNLKPDTLVLFTTAFCLLLFPDWVNSPSFHLSWLASLALSIPLSVKAWHAALFRQLLISLLVAPLILTWANFSLQSLLFNLTLGSVIGPILIPMALTPFWEPLMRFLIWTLGQLNLSYGVIESNLNPWWFILTSLPIQLGISHYRKIFWRSRCGLKL